MEMERDEVALRFVVEMLRAGWLITEDQMKAAVDRADQFRALLDSDLENEDTLESWGLSE